MLDRFFLSGLCSHFHGSLHPELGRNLFKGITNAPQKQQHSKTKCVCVRVLWCVRVYENKAKEMQLETCPFPPLPSLLPAPTPPRLAL